MSITAQSPVLLFKANGDGTPDGHCYWTFSKCQYQIQPGDFLEYEIFIDKISTQLQSGLDIHFQSGKTLRDSGSLDQNGISTHPWHTLIEAGDTWYHRKIDLSKLVGETTGGWQIAILGSLKETYFTCVANIQIVRNDQITKTIYKQGDPDFSESKLENGFSNQKTEPIRWQEYRQKKLCSIEKNKLSPEIQMANRLQKLMPEHQAEWDKLLKQAEEALDIPAYLAGDDLKFQASLKTIQATLMPILAHAKAFRTHLIGHAHIDMNWLWVWDETVAVLKRDFKAMTQLMEEFPMFRFSQSQAVTYKVIEKNYPELFQRVQHFVKNKQWEITASMWVEGDENLTSGEALVRQFLLGKRYIMDRFGVEPVVCWQPDLFGHVWTMPQIIKKCGSKYYFFMRCPKKNITAFWWQGPDGSKVLAYNTPNYNGTVGPAVATYPVQLFEQEGIPEYLHSFGVGDHGGGPSRKDITASLELQKNPVIADIKFNTVEGYFENLLNSGIDLPTVNDELQFIFPGCYTTHADIKLRNRQCENLFPTLEFFSLMAMPFELAYPNYILDEGWERTCFNHFHDILPGSGIHAAYQEGLPITDGAIAAGEAALQRSLQILAEQIDTDIFPEKSPLVVFNSCNWERDDLVQTTIQILNDEFVEVFDQQENPIPCQITNRTTEGAILLFVARAVPSMGYRTFWMRKVKLAPVESSQLGLTADFKLENEFYRLKIDPATGCLVNLIDKNTNHEFIAAGQLANIFQLHFEKPGGMSAWVIGEVEDITFLKNPVKIEVLEKGPVRILLQVTHRFNKSEFRQQIALYSGLRRVDFPCIVDWYEQGSSKKSGPMLKVAFPLALNQADVKATFEIPFGHIVREANGAEVPALRWIDVSDKNSGVSLLNDCKHGHDVDKSTMRLTLLRSSYEPDQAPDQGRHYFRYALWPHLTSWQETGSERRGKELNQPLRCVALPARKGKLETEQALVTTSAPNVIISAFKKCEENDEMVLRFYETHGKAATVDFQFAFDVESVVETDMLERELENGALACEKNSLTVSLTPFEIKTVRLKRTPFTWPVRHGFIPVE